MITEDFPGLQGEIERTQVMVFAGGMGKRMGINYPKALLELDGQTLLDRCIEFYSNVGFTKFVFVLGYGHREILQHMQKRERGDITATYSIDPETGMGRATSFRHALGSGAVDLSQRSMIVYPDDLFTDEKLPRQILSEHLWATKTLGTHGSLVLAKGLRWPYGTADVEESGLVTQFVEKPIVYYPASVGNYVFEPVVYGLVPDRSHNGPVELEHTLIPQLSRSRKLYALFIPSESWLPINTRKDLEEAQKTLAQIHSQKRAPYGVPVLSAGDSRL
ncbi:MAG: sugar phosphate nucleotidyltransferase [Thaumarchaeota archaeon]|nr:sugar phosphate nucleotidyltransferase [Nitrososphaerota archaeon]